MKNGEEYRYILTEYLNNWTIFYWVLKRKLSRSLSGTSSSRCCIINCCMNSWLRISDSRICWRWSFWNSIIWSDKLFFGFSLTLAFLWFCFTGISVENISQNCFLWNFFSTLNKTIYDFNRTLSFSKNSERKITTFWSSSSSFKY